MVGFGKERQHPAIHFAFCQIHRSLGNGELSEKACIIAAEQHRNDPLAHYELAKTFMILGKAEKAIKELRESAQLDQKNSKYPFESGMIFNYLNQNDRAKESFKKALSLDKNNIDAAYQLAFIYATRKDKDQALNYINQILDKYRDKPQTKPTQLLKEYIFKNATEKLSAKVLAGNYHLDRSQSLYKSKQFGLSIIEAETAARLNPSDLRTQEILVGIHSIFLRLDKAEKSVKNFIKLSGKDEKLKSRGFQEWGDIEILRGRIEEARAHYEKAKSLGDINGIAKVSLNEIPEKNGPAEQQPLNPNFLFIDPIRALNSKGEIFAHFGMYQRAMGIYSMILRMEPTNLTALLNTATANYKIEKYSRSISILERLFVIHPDHENIIAHRLLLARSYVMKGELDEGIKNLSVILKLNPGIKKVILADPVFDKLGSLKAFRALLK